MEREAFALMLCKDGVEEGMSPLIDGDDAANSQAALETLDAAYELKELNPEAVVSIIVCFTEDDADRASGALQVGLGY